MTTRALLLFGGGLDGLVADALLRREGVEVARLHFDTGFVKEARARVVDYLRERGEIDVVDVWRRYLLEVVLPPGRRRGSGMNPCVDCRIFMLRQAAGRAAAQGIALLATGEVLGQRAFDQNRGAIERIDRAAGVTGRVHRPLSARLLPPTGLDAPALGLHGSGRREQLRLARELGIDGAPTPSGGCCLLADGSFARRLRDLVEHRDPGELRRVEIERLRFGRHFRLDWAAKLVVARNGEEGGWLESRVLPGETLLHPVDRQGALALLDARVVDEETTRTAAAIVARYCRPGDCPREIAVRAGGGERRLVASPAAAERLRAWRV